MDRVGSFGPLDAADVDLSRGVIRSGLLLVVGVGVGSGAALAPGTIFLSFSKKGRRAAKEEAIGELGGGETATDVMVGAAIGGDGVSRILVGICI